MVTGPPNVSGQDLNPGPLSLEESTLLTELMRTDEGELWMQWGFLHCDPHKYQSAHPRAVLYGQNLHPGSGIWSKGPPCDNISGSKVPHIH